MRGRVGAAALLSTVLPLGIIGLSVSCGHAPERLTWDEVDPADRGEITSRPLPQPVQRPTRQSLELAPANPAGPKIDRALASFKAKRVSSARAPRTSTRHGDSWLEVLKRIDEAVVVEPIAGDLGAFVRARVMLEVEFQRDLDKRRLLPSDLSKRIKRTLASVDQRVAELRLSGATGTFQPTPRLFEGDLILNAPVQPMVVSSGFGVRRDPLHGGQRFHAGIDVAAAHGTPVQTSAAGIVIYAGWQGGFGRHVVIDHGNGVRTHYSHLASIWVKTGEIIEEKQIVGELGSSGRSTGPHLHFAVTNYEGRFLDPLQVLYTPFPIDVISSEVALK
jgi:murein DD-endopeptidase MepM/ murein hydrolase activator NlpD